MNLHEYQAKHLLKQYGVPVPDGKWLASGKCIRGVHASRRSTLGS